MPSVAVRLDEDLQQRLKRIAKADDRTPHYVMKKAIEAFVVEREKRDEQDRISFERWEEYKRTGITIPGEEVFSWIASLEEAIDDDDADAA